LVTGSRPDRGNACSRRRARRALLGWSTQIDGDEVVRGARRGTGGARPGPQAIHDTLAAGARSASSSAPVVVGGRGDADGGRSLRRPIRAAMTAARAPRGALPPWLGGRSGAATPSAWGRAAPGGQRRRRRRQRRGATAGASLARGGAVARVSVPCGGAAGSREAQSAAVLPPARDAHLRLPLSSFAGAVTPTGGGLPVVRFWMTLAGTGTRQHGLP